MPSSGSVEPVASKVHVRPLQVRLISAVGGWFFGGVSLSGRSSTVHMVAVLLLELATAVRPPVVAGAPAVSAAGRSVSSVATRPPPEPKRGGADGLARGGRPARRGAGLVRPVGDPPGAVGRVGHRRRGVRGGGAGLAEPVDRHERVARVDAAVGRERQSHLGEGAAGGQLHRGPGVAGDRTSAPHGRRVAAVDHPPGLDPAGSRSGQRAVAARRGEQQQGVVGPAPRGHLDRERGGVGVAGRLPHPRDGRRRRRVAEGAGGRRRRRGSRRSRAGPSSGPGGRPRPGRRCCCPGRRTCPAGTPDRGRPSSR